MSEAAPVTIAGLDDAKCYNLEEYDVIGFGGGIYYGKHGKELMEFAETVPDNNKYCFVFSTSGTKNFQKNNRALVKLLESKNKTVLGSFGCRGLDKFFIFSLFGGLNKGHPDIQDFDNAQQFICEVVEKYKEQTKQ